MTITTRSDILIQPLRTSATDYDVAQAARVSTKGADVIDSEGATVRTKVRWYQRTRFSWLRRAFDGSLQASSQQERAAGGRSSLPTGTVGPEEVPTDGATKGLINFLMRDRHGSPFEHNSMTFYVEAPIFVAREWFRHRAGWSYNEESARYKELGPVFYIPAGDRNLVQVGKPGAYRFKPGTAFQHLISRHAHRAAYRVAWVAYQAMLRVGIAREVARNVLPVGTYTSFIATCNARSLMHFLSLRTQRENAKVPSFPLREIAMAAEQMEAHFAEAMPATHAAFEKHGRVAP